MAYASQSVGTCTIQSLGTGGATITPGTPSGVTSGDLLVCFVYARQTTSSVSVPGYELLDTTATSGRLTVYGRIATGSSDIPTVTVTQSTSGYVHTQIARFTGSIGTIGTAGATIRDQPAAEATAAANDIVTGSQSTPSVDGCLILYVGAKLNDVGTASALPNSSTLISNNSDVTSSLTSIWSYEIQTTKASVAGSLFDFTNDANTYYSTVLTLKPAATTKYLKLLADSPAASATGVEVVVFSAPSGSNYITGTTRYGSANGQEFEASLESGSAVLKVLASDVGCSGLAAATTVAALAQNTTYTTGMVEATIIEE